MQEKKLGFDPWVRKIPLEDEESKDCAYFLTFVFSMSVKISIMEKIFLRQLHILAVYSRD